MKTQTNKANLEKDQKIIGNQRLEYNSIHDLDILKNQFPTLRFPNDKSLLKNHGELSLALKLFPEDRELLFNFTLADPENSKKFLGDMLDLKWALESFPEKKQFIFDFLVNDQNRKQEAILITCIAQLQKAAGFFPEAKELLYKLTLGQVQSFKKLISCVGHLETAISIFPELKENIYKMIIGNEEIFDMLVDGKQIFLDNLCKTFKEHNDEILLFAKQRINPINETKKMLSEFENFQVENMTTEFEKDQTENMVTEFKNDQTESMVIEFKNAQVENMVTEFTAFKEKEAKKTEKMVSQYEKMNLNNSDKQKEEQLQESSFIDYHLNKAKKRIEVHKKSSVPKGLIKLYTIYQKKTYSSPNEEGFLDSIKDLEKIKQRALQRNLPRSCL